MKKIYRFALIAFIGGGALCLWRRHPPSAETEPERVSASILFPVPAPNRRTPVIAPMPAPPIVGREPAKVKDDKMVFIRAKLAKWFEANRNGAEEDAEPLIDELKLILTDANAPEIVQSLSAEEQASPFGLAALGRWMESDPVKASSWIAANPTATQDQVWVVAGGWMDDIVGLQQYIDQLPDNAWKHRLLAEASSEALTRDPSVAVNLAQQIGPSRVQTDLLQAMAGHWIDRDPNAALNWIAKVDDPALRAQLVASAAKSYVLPDSKHSEARESPAGAVR